MINKYSKVNCAYVYLAESFTKVYYTYLQQRSSNQQIEKHMPNDVMVPLYEHNMIALVSMAKTWFATRCVNYDTSTCFRVRLPNTRVCCTTMYPIQGCVVLVCLSVNHTMLLV
jgi:hypothetical protein